MNDITPFRPNSFLEEVLEQPLKKETSGKKAMWQRIGSYLTMKDVLSLMSITINSHKNLIDIFFSLAQERASLILTSKRKLQIKSPNFFPSKVTIGRIETSSAVYNLWRCNKLMEYILFYSSLRSLNGYTPSIENKKTITSSEEFSTKTEDPTQVKRARVASHVVNEDWDEFGMFNN